MVENEEAALRAEIARLNKMVVALMNRAERAMSAQGCLLYTSDAADE